MAEPTNETAPTEQAPEVPAAAATSQGEAETMKAELARLVAHKEKLEADLAKYRKRNEADAAKAKEAGDFAKLLEIEKEQRQALEAQVTELSGYAAIGKVTADKAAKEIEEAKADATIPGYVRKALEAARTPIDAADILREFRSAAAPAAQKPVVIAPAQGAAPAASPSKTLAQMTPEEIINASDDTLNKVLGKQGSAEKSFFSRFIPQ